MYELYFFSSTIAFLSSLNIATGVYLNSLKNFLFFLSISHTLELCNRSKENLLSCIRSSQSLNDAEKIAKVFAISRFSNRITKIENFKLYLDSCYHLFMLTGLYGLMVLVCSNYRIFVINNPIALILPLFLGYFLIGYILAEILLAFIIYNRNQTIKIDINYTIRIFFNSIFGFIYSVLVLIFLDLEVVDILLKKKSTISKLNLMLAGSTFLALTFPAIVKIFISRFIIRKVIKIDNCLILYKNKIEAIE